MDACVVKNQAAHTLSTEQPDMRGIPPGVRGTVVVVLGLNTNSEIVVTKIQSTPSALLNNAAIRAVRDSRFQTEIRNCKPIASEYLLSVVFR